MYLFSLLWGKLHCGSMRKLENDPTEKSFRTMSLKTFCLMIVGEYIVSGPLPSSKNSHFQKEAKYTTFLVKTKFFCTSKKSFLYQRIQGQGELENGLWVSQGKRWGPLDGRREKGMIAKIDYLPVWERHDCTAVDLDKNLPLHNSFLCILLYTYQILYPITTIFTGFKWNGIRSNIQNSRSKMEFRFLIE